MDSSQSNNNDDNNNSIINSNKYGYDETLFISPPADFLRCCICSLILHNPIQIVNCGHKYCGGCFQRLRTSMERNNEILRCPIDRNVVEVSKVFEDIAMKRVVGSLKVRCYQADEGCDWNGELTELEVHKGKCQYLCQRSQQQAPDHELIRMVQTMDERVEKMEKLMAEKEKEVLHHKFTVMEIKAKYEGKFEELEQVKKLLEENTRCRSEQRLKVEVHEQRLIDMELKLSETLKHVDLLVRKVEEVQTKNAILEQEVKEYQKEEELSKQDVELKFKTNADRVRSLEDQVRPLEELFKAKKTEPVVLRPIDGQSASLSATSSKQQQPLHKKVVLMQPRGKDERNRVLISTDNHIQFQGPCTGTVTCPSAVVPRHMKVFYEVDLVRGGSYWLRVGWATKEFLTLRDKFVGGDVHSYSYGVKSLESHRRHKGSYHPWGKTFIAGGQNVIGVAIDMVNGQMLFGLNGQWNHPMGVAFENIDIKKIFFPAISFGQGELQVNFGERDFVYGPPDGSYINIIDSV